MLHKPPAQRSATNPRIPRRNRSSTRHPRLSVTLGHVPKGKVLTCREAYPGHWLVTIAPGHTFGEVVYAYISEDIPKWIVDRLFELYETISPIVDPDGYRSSRWWDEDWIVDIDAVYVAEQMSEDRGDELITPWDHEWLRPSESPLAG